MEPTATALLLTAIGLLLAAAAAISPVSQRLGVPALLVVLLIGMLAGSEGVGGIPFDNYHLAFRLGTIALVLILFDGGLDTPVPTFRRVLVRAGVLATVAVLLTALFAAGIGRALGLPLALAILVGAVVSSTDAAAVFAVLRGSRVRLRATTGATLEVESGLNDPMAVILTVAATEILLGTETLGIHLALSVFGQLAIGTLGGVGFGLLARAILRAVRLPAAGLYPVLTVAVAFAAFGVPTLLDGSGFLAVYLAAMILAAGRLPYRAGIRRVHDALAWLSQLLMFLLLGLLVFPSRLWPMAGEGLALAVGLAFVARPLAVLLTLLPFRAAWRERVFVAWVGLRGAVPIILAAYPVLRGVPQGESLFHLVFFAVLVNSILPGATVGWLANRWRLVESMPPTPPASVELVSLQDYPGEFVWYSVRRASAVAGALVNEVPLREGCVLVLVLRGDRILAARGRTRLEEGDHVCVFVTSEDRAFLGLLFGRPEGDHETPGPSD
jgi:cell volume regulation protein A